MSSHQATPLHESWLEQPTGQCFWLKGRCLIGRQEGSDLAFPTPSISRQHSLLVSGPGGYTLTDLHSSNGTYLNGELVKRPLTLRDGDVIRMGEVSLRFRCSRTIDLEGEAEGSATRRIDDVRPRICWLLVSDIAGYSALNERIGGEAALRLLQEWITGMRPVLEGSGASINGYVGDAIFAYWVCESAAPAQVLASLAGIEAYRTRSPLPFRVVVHHGCALFTKSEKGEELTGQDVNFVFRAEKVSKGFKVQAMLSQAAAQTLGVEAGCDLLGSAAVDGMTGTFSFYGFPRELVAPYPAAKAP